MIARQNCLYMAKNVFSFHRFNISRNRLPNSQKEGNVLNYLPLVPDKATIVAQLCVLTHWGRVTHMCVSNLTIIGSDNSLPPGRRQAITWTNVGILLIGPLGTNFSEMSIEIHTFSFKKIHLKLSSGKWRPFQLGLNVSKNRWNPFVGRACMSSSVAIPCPITSSACCLLLHWLGAFPDPVSINICKCFLYKKNVVLHCQNVHNTSVFSWWCHDMEIICWMLCLTVAWTL